MNTVATLPIALPADAPLPQRYEAARKAIAECDKIDECKNWADKAAALASYARQAKDDTLRVMAVRIQARAERRCGQMYKQIKAQPGKRTDLEPGGGAPTRLQAAAAAGMSKDQMVQSLRVASVPEAEFDARVESPRPPSITLLANLGKDPRAPTASPWQEIECAATRETCETLERFAHYCERSGSDGIGRDVNATEAQAIRRLIEIADSWLDRLAANLTVED